MSNADEVKLVFAEQTDYGTIGTTTGTELRFTSEDLKQDTTTVPSAEIRDDRQVNEVIRTSIQASGNVNGQVSYGTYDALMKLALFSSGFAAGAAAVTGTTISAAAASGSTQVISDSGSGFGSITVNQWVRISGFSNTANNGLFKVTASAAGSITVLNPSGVLEAAGQSVTVKETDQIVNGTTHGYGAIERVYGDLSTPNKHALYTGLQVDTLGLNIAANQILTVALGLVGKQETSGSSAQFTTVNDANTNTIMSATSDVLSSWEGAGTALSNSGVCILDAAINVNNNLRPRPCIGELGPDSWGAGKFSVSGTVRRYFATAALLDKYLNDTVTALAFTLRDSAGNDYIFDLPRVKYTSGTRVAGGENTDVIADLAYTAYRDPTEGITMRICKLDA